MEYWLLFGICFWIYSSYLLRTSDFKPKDSTEDLLDPSEPTYFVADRTEPKPSYPKGGVVFEGDYSPKLMFISAEAKQEYMRTQQWKDLKAERMRIARNKCECCGSPFNLHLHHVTYIRLTKERIEDLLILCSSCHDKMHKKLGKDRATIYPLSAVK